VSDEPNNLTFVIVGANHRQAPLALRDSLFAEDAEIPAILSALGLEQAIYLATCDRVEIIGFGIPNEIAERAHAFLANRGGLDLPALIAQTYTKTGEAVVRHLFAVASGLDSLVIGEPQVLGQVKAAHRMAREAGKVGRELDTLLQATFAAAKRVRSETRIGERPVSMASAGVSVGRDLLGDFKDAKAVLLGDGDMGQLVAESFIKAGLGHLLVSAPREARALALARQYDVPSAPFDDLVWLLSEADIALVALSAPAPVVDSARVQAALKKRKRKPMLILDLSIPGDVEASVERVDDAFLYDLEDLERVAEEGLSHRMKQADAAWAVVDDEVAGFRKAQAGREAAPLIVRLRQYFENERARALQESGGDADRATQLLMNRLLHAPSEVLKEQGDKDKAERMLEDLFRLSDEERKS
jgi:glutamyl-tRNA reductase